LLLSPILKPLFRWNQLGDDTRDRGVNVLFDRRRDPA
jgi:hypothetical protein